MTLGNRPTAIDDLEDLFDHAPCGYVVADKDGRILRANKTLAAWLGVDAGDLIGQRFADFLTVGGKLFYETHFAPMLRMEGACEVAFDMTCADGRKLPVLANAVERRDESGALRSIRIVIFDASQRRRYERGLVEAKVSAEQASTTERAASELREQFIAVLGHDLRNPLASIAGGVRLLEREQLSERAKRVLSLMDGSVVRAAVLIDNVMDFARGRLGGGISLDRDEGKPLQPVIEQVVAEMQSIAPDRVIEAQIEISQPVSVDHSRVGQLVSNLLGNAITHGAEDEPVRLSASTSGGVFELWVANGGDPIPADTMAHLFQPFFRGSVRPNQQGLGLGLHIASEIAKAHGGTLTVSSTAEETRFTFRMPLA